MRPDIWWQHPLLVFLGLSTFIVYSTWAAFQGTHYFFGNYISPFLFAGNFWRLPAQLVWAKAGLVARLAVIFARTPDPVGARAGSGLPAIIIEVPTIRPFGPIRRPAPWANLERRI